MIERNINYRAAIYAALYTPPKGITRESATSLYNDIAQRAFPKLALAYTPAEDEKPFSIVMEQKSEGRRTDTVTVDLYQGLLRLQFHESWPDSFDVACKRADEVASAMAQAVPECQVQLVEARIRAQVPIPEKSGNDFLISRLMPQKKGAISGLGPISHFGIRYEVRPDESEMTGPLASPGREVSVEALKQEQGALYIEVMSNWGRVALRMSPDMSGQAEIAPGPLSTSAELPPPSSYLGEVKNYIETSLCPFLEKTP
jgi:hypothetical protein